MREIKFRGMRMRDAKGCTLYGDLRNSQGNFYIYPIGDRSAYEVKPETIGQYTGLKDKNGKEIYEGDIVEWVFFYEKLGAYMGVKECDTIVKGIIRWRQGGFVLEIIENDFENAGYYSISALYTDTEADVEVIGNIHSNNGLL